MAIQRINILGVGVDLCPPEELEEKILDMTELCDTHDPAGIVACLKGVIQREDTSAFLAGCNIPVLAVCGSSDSLVTEEYRARIATECKNVRLEILPDCGHNVFFEQPSIFLADRKLSRSSAFPS